MRQNSETPFDIFTEQCDISPSALHPFNNSFDYFVSKTKGICEFGCILLFGQFKKKSVGEL